VSSLYLHIPFCERKCPYCDFYSVEHRSQQAVYVAALREELRRSAAEGFLKEIDTIYFGGGTPSLLAPFQLEQILTDVFRSYAVLDGAEVTLEVNPGTVTREILAGFRSTGVNRLSIGIQSFTDEDLMFLGRIHDVSQAERCIRDARDAGFTNISIDLIFSLPGQEPAAWEGTLRRALEFAPEHISAYGLIVEPGTPLHQQVLGGRVRPNDPECEAAFYELTMDRMRAGGYEQYEVSNYARPGFRSRHNSSYWRHADYRGLGPSAHSFRKDPGGRTGRRWWNVPDLPGYLERVHSGEDPVGAGETVGEREMVNERIFLGLRSDGLDVRRLDREFGVDLSELHPAVFESLVADGRASWDGVFLRLTPRGYLLCDEIAGYLMLS
jgi:oxygen-independent coproporphyrinogen III oxidase